MKINTPKHPESCLTEAEFQKLLKKEHEKKVKIKDEEVAIKNIYLLISTPDWFFYENERKPEHTWRTVGVRIALPVNNTLVIVNV